MTQEELVAASKINYSKFNQEFTDRGYSPGLWNQVKKTILKSGLSVVQYRQLWRSFHPNGSNHE